MLSYYSSCVIKLQLFSVLSQCRGEGLIKATGNVRITLDPSLIEVSLILIKFTYLAVKKLRFRKRGILPQINLKSESNKTLQSQEADFGLY